MALEMQALAGNRHTNVAELNRLLVSQLSQLEQQQKYKQIKRPNTNTKMNDNINMNNMNSTITESMNTLN